AVRDRYPDKIVVVLSSYNTFEFVRETLKLGAIDYILKPEMDFEELVGVLRRAADDLRRRGREATSATTDAEQNRDFISYLFYGDAREEERSWPYDGSRYLALFRVVDKKHPRHDIAASVVEMISSMDCCSIDEVFTLPQRDSVAAMLKSDRTEREVLAARLRNLVDSTAPTLRPRGVIVSEALSAVPSGREAATRLLEALPAFFYSTGVILDLPTWSEPSSLNLDKELLNKLADHLDTEGLKTWLLRRLDEERRSPRPVGPTALKSWVSEACFYVIHRLDELGTRSEEISAIRFAHLVKVEDSGTVEELADSVDATCRELRAAIEKTKLRHISPVVARVKAYVEDQFRIPIRLDALAATFGINPSYLSHIFREQIGSSPMDYLSKIRIEHAKELLRRSSQTVYQIASEVGFDDAGYFGKVFKKYTGMRPSAYRDIYYQSN
ncbi:MAG TPA: helix-turn-helix domain-containing protein, partial [Spirochaetia bacterium]|nr:helix-turn-helix domain-containing protein [Spirochaetia bacterium]